MKLPKHYNPQKVESEIYKKWEDSEFFKPETKQPWISENEKREPYSIIMPPPNVTGVLHLGHALENSIMDIMTRYQRMQGKKVVLVPGTDHAAVATQAKVEKVLIEEEGYINPRQELGREKLLEKIKEYADNSQSTILNQIKKMGTSCDWSRLAYTLDEQRHEAVNKVFEKMYKNGLIYRGYKAINWSVKGQSTCSDDELEYQERQGKLYTFKYSNDFPISIATTRPETKLGDTAVAVNPKDDRYKEYIGQTFEIQNFANSGKNLQIKIIANEEVDMNFGTGAVGVTPAHSMTDFEMFENQKAKEDPIEIIPVINKDGKINKNGGSFQGLTAEEAREKIIDYFKENNLLEKEEDVPQNVSTSDRFGDITEVLPMTQWFVAVNKKIPGKDKTLKELMAESVWEGLGQNESQKIEIAPDRFEKLYFQWINNLRDWCISRQVWWGHRIPVWYCQNPDCGKPFVSKTKVQKCPICGGEVEQDPDTLDTWFSSGLWSFSTLGYPQNFTNEKKTGDLAEFHPTNWMQMGYEILFFWMARMILMSTYTLNEIPFKNVYIHGILRDEKGNKFSKSAGNTLDPIEVADQYGTDALRLSLISGISPGNDSKFYEEKVENSRNFINKLWNISRYILESQSFNFQAQIPETNLTLADKFILEKMRDLIENTTQNLESSHFSLAYEQIYEFIWNDFADWYLEASKFEENKEAKSAILSLILKDSLKLLHPFAPFATEYIWSLLQKETMLIAEQWPKKNNYIRIVEKSNVNSQVYFYILQEIIREIRNLRTEHKIETNKKIKVLIDTKNLPQYTEILSSQEHLIKNLRTGVEKLEISPKTKKPKDSAQKTINSINIYIPLAGLIDTEKEKQENEKEAEKLKPYIENLEKRLRNKNFTEKAPQKVVNKERKNLENARKKLEEIEKYIENLN